MARSYVYEIALTGLDGAGASVARTYATEGIVGATGFSEGRIKQAVVRQAMFAGDQLRGGMEPSPAAFTLVNRDGAVDELRSYAFQNRPISLNRYDVRTAAFVDTMLTLTADQPICGINDAVFSARDARASYVAPLLTTKYAGTNAGSPLAGIEGTANDLKGQPKPLAVGRCFNVSPNLVNTDRRIYQVDGQRGFATGWSMLVYDKRAPLTAGADYVSQADMETNVPAAGQYRVWPAGGCVRLGSVPLGAVTVDVINPAVDAFGNPIGSGESLQAIASFIVTLRAPGGPFSIAAWLASTPTSGVFLSTETTVLEAVSIAMESVNGYVLDGSLPVSPGTGARLNLMQLSSPASLPYTPMLSPILLTESDVLDIAPVVQQEERGVPVWRVNVNYARNYTVMSDTDLAGVAAADREFCKREYRTVQAENAAVKTKWPFAQELNVFTQIAFDTDASAEASRLLGIFGVEREMYQVSASGESLRGQSQFTAGGATANVRMFQIGCLVTLTHSRFRLTSGKTFMVIALEQDLVNDKYTMTLWG